ncbi:MAG: penicillin-binding protein 2, partial [Nitrospiraceae bacterium]
KLNRKAAKPFEPVTLKEDVTFEEVAKVEARLLDFPGLQIEVVGGREYLYGHSASHVLGYIGSMSARQMAEPKYSDIPPESIIGQYGIEKVYDEVLRGISGKKVIEVDAIGRIVKVVRIQRPINGRNIRLTINIDLQVEAEESLRGKAGAVVALKADTGEVLALASSPTFDPNLFVRGIRQEEWRKLINDPGKPLLNRAIQSQFPPGSTFKIITAIAALEQGIVSDHSDFYCNGSLYFGRVFRCWKAAGHGAVQLHKAIVESCDVYFYEVGKELNIDVLAQYAFGYGLGRPTGIGLEGEVSGLIPTSGWKSRTRKEGWYTGETLNTVIGQGYVSATPIQMARAIATVTNGGRLYEPTIVMESGQGPKTVGQVKIHPENLRLIREALAGVVREKKGTGHLAESEVVSIGGKTGTSQVISGVTREEDLPHRFRDHAWFVAVAPVERPEIAVAVFVEHGGHGSSAAAPIAKRVIEAYYDKDKGEEENRPGPQGT